MSNSSLMMKIFSLLVIMCVLVGCTARQPAYTEMRLPSGKLIKVLGAEVDEIWAAFRLDVERATVKNAIIAANEPPHGRFITTNRSFNFVFKKSPDGTWKQR